MKEACISYADKIWWEKDSDFFFLAPDKTMISPMTVYQRYRRYLEVAGISHGGKGQGPRLHDIRHTFAVHVLQKWIKEEADLTAMLPILSTYMGHKTVRSTSFIYCPALNGSFPLMSFFTSPYHFLMRTNRNFCRFYLILFRPLRNKLRMYFC